jgi:hypothetical protein
MAGRPTLSAWVHLLLGLVACTSGEHPLRFPSVSEQPGEPRRAPGVAVDPTPRLPEPTRTADSEQGLVVLRAPADIGQAQAVVKRFFRAVLHEAPDELEPLLGQSAWVRSAASGSVERAGSHWRARIARLDYGSLEGQLVYRESEMETYRPADLEQLGRGRRVAAAADGDDVVVKVPICAPHGGRVRLFGDEITFVLRLYPDGYKIIEMAEDFRLP